MYRTIEEQKKYSHEYYLKNRQETIDRTKKYHLEHKEHLEEMRTLNRHNKGINKPINKNKDCPLYLGVYVAENILSKEFNNIIRMPFANPGYDYICGKGFKIDVKSSCLQYKTINVSRWKFQISRNQIANYFLLIGFDNRDNLNPIHIWLIPGNIINIQSSIGIGNNEKSLNKYKIYERSLDNAIICCNKMKELK